MIELGLAKLRIIQFTNEIEPEKLRWQGGEALGQSVTDSDNAVP